MRYYKMTDADGKLTAIGTGAGGTEITAEEYTVLAGEIAEKAALRRAQALNVRVETYTQDALEAMTNAELERILSDMGVSVNMTKANMVTLILALQEEVAP